LQEGAGACTVVLVLRKVALVLKVLAHLFCGGVALDAAVQRLKGCCCHKQSHAAAASTHASNPLLNMLAIPASLLRGSTRTNKDSKQCCGCAHAAQSLALLLAGGLFAC
jgi:hypothetical protein